MKSITIHQLDDTITRMIEARAKSYGQSLNKTVKALLEQSLGMRPPEERRHTEDFAEFLGVWEDSDLREFERCTARLRAVENEDWQ
jgi:plasmid stability protein